MNHLLIIGANSDIAQATSKHYAKHGYSLSLAARRISQLEGFAQDLKIKHNCEIRLIELDILDHNQRQHLIKSLKKIPSAVLFAAGYLGDQQNAQNNELEAKKIFDSNFVGATALLDHFANEFEKNRAGVIMAISSVAGDRGRKSNYFYGAAKAALSTYLSGLRNRLYNSNVSVIDIKPGFVATKMTAHLELPNKLTTTPEHVAACIFNAHTKKKNVLYVAGIWQLIMLIIKFIPETIFKRLSL